jgi:hypothetical protein
MNPPVRRLCFERGIQWFTKDGQQAGGDVFLKWYKWLIGTHRIGQYDHMKAEYRHRLPEIEAEYQKWMAKLGG